MLSPWLNSTACRLLALIHHRMVRSSCQYCQLYRLIPASIVCFMLEP